MYIQYPDKLSKDSFKDTEIYLELIAIEDDLERQSEAQKIRSRAKELGEANTFDNMWGAAQKNQARHIKLQKTERNELMGVYQTNFSLLNESTQLNCGSWEADDQGVKLHTDSGVVWACPHPIFPTKVLRNAETGKYKVELVFQIRGKTRKIYVNREIIATPSKILKLADDSIQITNISAPLLVKYLADVETLNPEIIREYASTSRLGWIEDVNEDGERTKYFLPYQQDVIFDNELNTKALFDSITTHGDRDKWYSLIKDIRAKKQPEVLINLAASFASVLVDPCGALPFIVSLWGGTGIGKSVILKICTSVWADPGEGKYITDAKATTTAMEMRLNILNSLPMTLDDMAQIKNQYDEDFSELIYRWCAGKGRDRSNKELGLNKLTSWRNCTITNGERSLVDESTQGGAVNRVIDIEASGDVLFNGKTGNKTVNLIEKNYGFAGKEFIEIIEKIGFDTINQKMNEQYDRIKANAESKGVEKEDKQIVPMALILTADALTEEYLFKDGVTLDLDLCVDYLKNKGEVSEDKRAYEYLLGTITMNDFRFNDDDTDEHGNYEKWGFYKNAEWIAIFSNAFDKIMQQGGFQPKAFLSWAKKNNLLELGTGGRPRKNISKGNLRGIKAVIIKVVNDEEKPEESEFMPVLEDELPFK